MTDNKQVQLYRLDYDGYKKWYEKNVPQGIVSIPRKRLYTVKRFNGDQAIHVQAHGGNGGVGSMPARFLTPTKETQWSRD